MKPWRISKGQMFALGLLLGLATAAPFSPRAQGFLMAFLVLVAFWGLAKVLAMVSRRQVLAEVPQAPGAPFQVTFEDLCKKTGYQKSSQPPAALRDPAMRYLCTDTWSGHLEWLLSPRHPRLPPESIQERVKRLAFVEAELRKLAAEDDETIMRTRFGAIPRTPLEIRLRDQRLKAEAEFKTMPPVDLSQ